MADQNPVPVTDERKVLRVMLNYNALERLLGGNTELELELKTSVANAFAKKYLKALVQADVVQAAVSGVGSVATEAVRAEVERQVGVVERNYTGRATKIELAKDFQELLEKQIQKMVEGALQPLLAKLERDAKARMEDFKAYWQSRAEKFMVERFNEQIENQIEEGIRARLQKAAGLGG